MDSGLIGSDGLGDLAYRYDQIQYEVEIMYARVFILIVFAQGIQMIGNYFVAKLKKD